MKNFFISLLTGSIAAAAMVMVLVKDYGDGEHENQLRSMAVDSQHPVAKEENNVADFQKALDSAMIKVMDEVNAIKTDLEEIRSRQSTLSLTLDQLAQIGGSSTAGEQAAVFTQENFSDEGEPEEEPFISLDDAINAQESDSTWDDDAAALLTYSILDAGFENSHLQDVVCRGVMCRVEIYHDDENATAELFEGEQQLVPWDHKGVMETTTNEWGDLVTVMYITRDGYEFPGDFE